MTLRTRLPNRRPSHLETLEVGAQVVTACIGFDPATGRPREVFLSGAKDGTDLAAILDDASVILSVALQHDIPASALARKVRYLSLDRHADSLLLADQPAAFTRNLPVSFYDLCPTTRPTLTRTK